MKLGDIYKHKIHKNLIQIDSFATHINAENPCTSIIVYAHIEQSAGHYGHAPAFNGYGSTEEIEKEYELAISTDDFRNFNSFDEVIEYINNK